MGSPPVGEVSGFRRLWIADLLANGRILCLLLGPIGVRGALPRVHLIPLENWQTRLDMVQEVCPLAILIAPPGDENLYGSGDAVITWCG